MRINSITLKELINPKLFYLLQPDDLAYSSDFYTTESNTVWKTPKLDLSHPSYHKKVKNYNGFKFYKRINRTPKGNKVL